MALLLFLGLFGATNGEFFATANKQMVEGHEWNYVGKQLPDGNPAITVKPEHGDEYILFKLKK